MGQEHRGTQGPFIKIGDDGGRPVRLRDVVPTRRILRPADNSTPSTAPTGFRVEACHPPTSLTCSDSQNRWLEGCRSLCRTTSNMRLPGPRPDSRRSHSPEEIDGVGRGRSEWHWLGCDDLQVFERFYTICMDDRSDVGEGIPRHQRGYKKRPRGNWLPVTRTKKNSICSFSLA